MRTNRDIQKLPWQRRVNANALIVAVHFFQFFKSVLHVGRYNVVTRASLFGLKEFIYGLLSSVRWCNREELLSEIHKKRYRFRFTLVCLVEKQSKKGFELRDLFHPLGILQ